MADHDILSKAEAHYYADAKFREKVEEVVTTMTIGISRSADSPGLRHDRLLIRMTASVALYMNEGEHD
jgi:hypothetical protein